MQLILVRHPQPLVAAGVCYGRTDLPVAPEEQARTLASLTATLPKNAALFTSPLQRCAELAARLPQQPLIVDARLAEMDFGAWEMQSWDDIPRADIDAWAVDLIEYHPGGGESVLKMAARVQSFYADLQRQQGSVSNIIICHAGTIRLLRALHAGLPLRTAALHAAQTPHKIAYGESLILSR
jgi:alpha-ribazole phosphatase